MQPRKSYLPLAAIAFKNAYAVSHDSPLLHEEDVLEGLHKFLRVSPPLSKPDDRMRSSVFYSYHLYLLYSWQNPPPQQEELEKGEAPHVQNERS